MISNKKTKMAAARKKITQKQSDAWERMMTEGLFKYQALFDSNMLGIAATDFEDEVIMANDAFLSLIGYTQDDVEAGRLKWSTISPTKYNEVDLEKIDELLRKKRIVPFEKEYIHKRGHTVPVLVGAEVISEDPSFGVCFVVEITKLKEREQKKDDFVGLVSHELKTPLSVMRLSAEFIKSLIHENSSKKKLLGAAHEIEGQIDTLRVLIQDLLNMVRYEAHESSFPVSGLNVAGVVSKVVHDLSKINDREIELQSEDHIYVSGNQDRLSQVFINLINNALKYSPSKSRIEVRVWKDAHKAYIAIKDFGRGIAEHDIPKIFERYYRVEHAREKGNKSTGIGLYISNEIIKFHRGKISVESTLGRGSTFTVELPLL